jgi:Xaa-Pro aminopeptidase
VSDRTERLIELLPEAGVEELLVTALVNVRYLTGFTGSSGVALIGPSRRMFITDFRYLEQAAVEVDPSFQRRILTPGNEMPDELAEAIGEGPLRLGFEDEHVTVRGHARLRELPPDEVALIAAGDLVEQLRAVKEPGEVERIRAAAALADAALEQVLEGGLAGRTERAVAIALEQAMVALGAQRPSFDTIVAAGPHGALPHARPREVEIGRGELVVIDWGAELDGYCSDCTRTFATGDPGSDAREVYRLVREAQLAGAGALRAGAGGREVDAVARGLIEEGGYGEQFGHGLGHGVGIEVHEGPRLTRRSDDELVAGNVVTVEPGIYLPGRFGVRIEDLVLVTENGHDVLSSLGKDLIAIA